MISVAFLIVLFSVQKYGTSKVGLIIGPALFIWFCLLGGIGIYNLIIYDTSVLKAFNPVHIYYYFQRNSVKAWYSLGGCLLCVTGMNSIPNFRSFRLTVLFIIHSLITELLSVISSWINTRDPSLFSFYLHFLSVFGFTFTHVILISMWNIWHRHKHNGYSSRGSC